MDKYLFITGNGFDLDLGLKTRYSDFANNSSIFSNSSLDGSALCMLLNKVVQRNPEWFDIEEILKNYAQLPEDENERKLKQSERWRSQMADKQTFDDLIKGFREYILQEQGRTDLQKDSYAARLLRAVVENGKYTIYTFNYTDMNRMAQSLGIRKKFQFDAIHGRAADKSIILGVDDEVDVFDGMEFLYKTFNRYYQSHSITHDLQTAEEVIIFGHSLSSIDYPYFQDFFRMVCQPGNAASHRKRITIFTYDETSRLSLMKQLRTMNEHRTNYLYNQNDFTFICTSSSEQNDGIYPSRFEDLLKHLNETSEAENQRRMDNLARMIH